MKDCIRFAPMIGAREGELAPAEAKALEAHLSACLSCRAFARDVAAMDGLVGEALLARAATRDFAPFVDEVMAKVGHGAGRRGLLYWLGHHRRAAAATLTPVLAALAVIVYVQFYGGRGEIALFELTSEGEVTTVLQTADGPVVLLGEETGS
jgi:predicted anti-sigma-YlaC factor YlaD